MRIIKKSLGIAILLLATQVGFAQLSGTYTIGGTSPKFATISEAVDSLETYGVNGAVTLHIRQGNYTEQISIGKISGTSSSNVVTFKTDPGSSVYSKITYTSGFVIELKDSVSYINFENLKIEATGSSTKVISLSGVTSFITLKKDSLISSTSGNVIDKPDGIWFKGITIENNVLIGGRDAISLYTNQNTLKDTIFSITGNEMYDFSHEGITIKNARDGNIEGNYLITSKTNSTGFSLEGVNFVDIVDNEVYVNARSIRFINVTGSSTSRNLVTGNIWSSSLPLGNGVLRNVFSYGNYSDIVFNSIYGKMPESGKAMTTLIGGTSVVFRNNIVHNDTVSNALDFTNGTSISKDYNNIYGNGGSSNFLNGSLGTNSISVDPKFLSATNLRPSNAALLGKGVAFSGVTFDIDSVSRLNPPTIGAVQSIAVKTLNGVYTVGGTSPNYATVVDAVSDLNANGMSDTVWFLIRSGEYQGNFQLNTVAGLDTSQLVFMKDSGAATQPIIGSWDSITTTIKLNGCNNVKFENLFLKGKSKIVEYVANSHYITFDRCSIKGVPGTTGQNLIYNQFKSSDHLTIQNSTIKNSYFALNINAALYDSLLVIKNNLFDSVRTAIQLQGARNASILGNTIKTNRGGNLIIYLNNTHGFKIEDNVIFSSVNGEGIIINNCSGSTSQFPVNRIVNNVINYTNTSSLSIPLKINLGKFIDVYNNTFSVNNSASLAYKSASTSNTSIKLVNNIFNQSGAASNCVDLGTSSEYTTSSNNVFYSSKDSCIKINSVYLGAPFLSSQLTIDTTSFNSHPQFFSTDSLLPRAIDLDSAGAYLASVILDISGATRTKPPDIGAYEFTGIPPLAGIYTIGGTTPDYPTLDSAAMDLNARGISAAVTFLIRPDTYVEHMFVDTIIGADSSKLVTFRNDTNFTGTVLIKDSLTKDNPGLFTFKNSGYVKIIGLNFEEDGLSVNTSSCIRLEGLCTDFYVDSCNFKANSSNFNNYYRSAIGTGESHVEISTDYPSGMTYQSERMEISNSTMVGFGYPVNIHGRSTHFILADSPVGKVINCTMTGVSNYSFFGSHLDTLVYSSNEVSGSSVLLSLTGNKSVTIDKNKFFSVGDNHVSFLNGLGNLVSASNPILITNNVFRSERSASTSERIGFNIRSDDHYSFFNNTIYLETNIEDTAHHKVFSVDDVKNLNFKNNNVIFNGTNGYVYDLDRPSGHNYDLDYNNVYSKSGTIGLLDGVEYPTLDSLHTLGYDFSSLSLNPRFNNDTLLEPHVTELVDAGDSISGITDDILGVSRDGTPSIGAYEYIYSCGGLSGTYSVGGTTPDYSSIAAAVEDINEVGICGDVAFNIIQGTYTDSIKSFDWYDPTDTSWVTFQADTSNTTAVLLSAQLASNTQLWAIDGSRRLKIKGLNFKATGSGVALIHFTDSTRDVIVDDCKFDATIMHITSKANDSKNVAVDHVLISNCEFKNGTTDRVVWLAGFNSKDITIKNNTFQNCNYAIGIRNIDSATIIGNVIKTTQVGIDINTVQSFNISNNTIQVANFSLTFEFLNGAGTSVLVNNVLYSKLTEAITSDHVSSAKVRGAYNTIVSGGSSVIRYGSPFGSGAIDYNFTNNNIVNTSTGNIWDASYGNSASFLYSGRNNNYYTSGDTLIKTTDSISLDLADIQRQYSTDTNSLSIHPRFNNDTLLEPHITELVDAGTPIAGITTDILGASRDTTPSIGAYEYTYTCVGLSGIYTINSSGSGAKNYTSISDAVDDLNDLGICADVTFNIRQGTYQETLSINEIYNAGDSGTVVFQANNGEVILIDTANENNYTGITLTSASSVHFVNLTFSYSRSNNYTNASSVEMVDECSNIEFTNCKFTGDFIDTHIGVGFGAVVSNFKVDSSKFYDSYRGISVHGGKNATITNNRFESAIAVSLSMDSSVIANNYMKVFVGNTDATGISVSGNSHEIHNNTIVGQTLGAGLGIRTDFADNINIYNNSISLHHKGAAGSYGTLTGIRHFNGPNIKVNFNTILLKHDNPEANENVGVRFQNNLNTTSFSNNNIVLECKGQSVQLLGAVGNLNSNYNNYSKLEGDTIMNNNNVSYYTSLDDIKVIGLDSNSVSINPYFLVDSLLKPYRLALDNKGDNISGITNDIVGLTRGSTPDIGAYQFDPIVYEVVLDSIDIDTLCSGLRMVRALIRNVGDSIVTDVKVNWGIAQFGNALELDSLYTFSGSLLADTGSAWVSLGSYEFSASTNYRITASADTINSYLNNDPLNSQLKDTISVRVNPVAKFTVPKACLTDSLVLIASGGASYKWSGPNGFSETSDTVVKLLTDTNYNGSYTLTAFDSLGCSADYTNTVTLDSAIIIDLPADDSICGSASFTLSANENTQYAYLWNNGETTPQIVVDSTFEYILRVTDQNICVNADTFNLTVYSDPIVAFDSTIQAACSFGNPIILNHAKPAGAGGIYTGSGSVSYISRDTLTPQGSGNYPVKYTYTDTNGCSGFADTVLIVYKRPSVALSTFTDLCINEAPYFISENSPVDTISGIFAGIGIVNDSIGIFDPAVADTGTHTIYYTYTDTSTGCSSVDSNTITVNDTFNIAFTAADYCINDGKVTLSKPSGIVSSYSSYYLDTNSNNAVFGTHGFNPFIADTGIQTLKYTVVNDDNCTSIAYRDITVNGIPVVSLQLDTFCVNAPSELMAGGLPTGGTYYYGVGVGSGTYYPDSAGVGLDTINYRFTQSNGCSDTAEAVFLIRQIPVVTFELPSFSTERCVDAIPFAFTGHSPVTAAAFGKGIFSILGDSVNQFEASVNGVGTHVVQFKYTDQFGCADSTSDSVIVHAIPQPSFTTPFSRICLNQIPDTVFASPFGVGGVFSGVGIDSAGYFNPSIVGANSNKTLTYTYTDTNGCSDFVVDTFIVDSVPSITLALIPDQCLNGVEYTFTEGKFNTGAHYVSTKLDTLIGGKYSPILADTGIDKITYIYTDGVGCSDSLSQNITVLDTTVVTFSISTVRAEVCENEVTFNLSSAKPVGGIYTGKGLVGNKFTPANADLGNNFITYAYTNGGNCKSVIIDTIKVNAITPVTYADQTFCLNDDTTIIRGGTPTIGIYKYSGSGMISDSLFVPLAAGTGPRTMTYALTNSDGCISQASATFTINSVPSTQFGAQAAICLNVAEISLRNASTSGDTSYFYNSTGLTNAATGKYLPAQSGVGLDTLGYVGINSSTGCADTIFNTILVHAIPVTTLDTFPDYCINNAPIALSKGNPKTGGAGIYSGKGIVGTQFYASIAKAGSHAIVYRFTDNNNCSTSDTEIVVINALPILTAVSLADLCLFDTSIILSGALPIGGIYSGVNVDSASAVFSPDSIGIWNIKYNYIDTNGCENDIAQTQRVRALPATQLNFSNKFCDNATPLALNGGSPIGVGGAYGGQGVAGTLYDPSLVTALIDTLVYSYTDTYGCENTDTVFVSFDSSAIITAIPLPDICKGTAVLDLSAYYSPLGGTYKGANVFGSNFNANLLDTGRFAMSYTYTDSNNCTTAAYDTVVILPLPDIQVSSDTGICQGDKIQLMVSGNYGYNWSTGDYLSTIQVSPLKTLSYSVTATNSFNCVVSKNIGVTVFDQISVFTSSVNASCNQANGTAFTSVAGGVKPYNYLWSTGQRTSNSRQLFAGNYQVTVNDKNGCTHYGVVGISNEDGPQVTVTSLVNNTCAGNESGEIEVSVSNDTAYTIQWNNGATGTKLTNLKSGIYELSVIGADGCSSFKSIEIKSPKAYKYQSIVEQPDCDSANGSIYLQLTNSLDSVTYTWVNQSVGDTLNSIRAGIYNVAVSNKLGCIDTVTLSLNTATAPRIKLDSIQFVDCNQSNGLLGVSGIDLISNFNWSNGDTTAIINNLSIGSYVITASDTSGCSTIEQFNIEGKKPTVPVICKVTNDSLIFANVLVWDTTGSAADSFYVYRESSVRNQYFKMATFGRSQAPRFEDNSFTNWSSIGSYSVVAIDACKSESEFSPVHKAILLSAKQTDSTLIELSWSNYLGSVFGDYYAYRYSSQFGLQLLDSINGINSFVDYNVPKNSAVLYYYVGIKGLTNCGDVGISTISNLSRDFGMKLVGISSKVQEEVSFLVWPNPSNGSFQIKLTGLDTYGGQLIVYDMHGKIRYQNGIDSSLQGSTQSVILPEISSGLYYVQFIQNETVITREIIVNR